MTPMPLRKRLPRNTMSAETRAEVRRISDRMGDLVAEMGALNDRAARTRDRAERERLREELCEKANAVLELHRRYCAIRHFTQSNRMGNLRSLSGDVDLDKR